MVIPTLPQPPPQGSDPITNTLRALIAAATQDPATRGTPFATEWLSKYLVNHAEAIADLIEAATDLNDHDPAELYDDSAEFDALRAALSHFTEPQEEQR